MEHGLFRIVSVSVTGPHALWLRFDDGIERTIELAPVLYGAIYGPLRDPAEFARVVLDSEVGTVTWPCGADFDPATLHDWPDHEAAWLEKARGWRMAAVG